MAVSPFRIDPHETLDGSARPTPRIAALGLRLTLHKNAPQLRNSTVG
jgi:hypothetical protein